jgi:hypothetical protein
MAIIRSLKTGRRKTPKKTKRTLECFQNLVAVFTTEIPRKPLIQPSKLALNRCNGYNPFLSEFLERNSVVNDERRSSKFEYLSLLET